MNTPALPLTAIGVGLVTALCVVAAIFATGALVVVPLLALFTVSVWCLTYVPALTPVPLGAGLLSALFFLPGVFV